MYLMLSTYTNTKTAISLENTYLNNYLVKEHLSTDPDT